MAIFHFLFWLKTQIVPRVWQNTLHALVWEEKGGKKATHLGIQGTCILGWILSCQVPCTSDVDNGGSKSKLFICYPLFQKAIEIS